MSFRISYRDALGVDRLVAVADSGEGAQMLVKGLAAEVPRASSRLSVAEDPRLDFSMQVVAPPYFLDNPAGLPVVYLGGGVDTNADWQSAAIGALRPARVVIANSRRERVSISQDDVDDYARWCHRHLLLADAAVFWFEVDDHDPVSLLEPVTVLGYTPQLAVGAVAHWPRRAEMRGLLCRLGVNVVVHDSLDATLTHARNLVEESDAARLSNSLSLPGAAEGELSFSITHTIAGRSSAERISDVLAAAAYAAARSTESLLLTRLYVAVDELRLDDADPLAWTELHDIASTLQQRH